MAPAPSKNISPLPRPNTVRNVVTVPKNSYPTTDEVFAAQYAKAGLQPSDLAGTNDNLSPAEQEKARRIAQRQAEYMEQMGVAFYEEQLFEQQQAAIDAEKIAAIADLQNQIGGSRVGKAATQAAAITLNTPTALWMTAWHTWAYLTFQLPLAILCIALFAMAAAVESTWLSRQVGSLLSYVSADPKTFFLIVNTALWGLCFLGLIATMFAYIIRKQSPLNGDRATAKYLSVLGCLIGYAIPFLNLFPWIGIYIFVMWTSRD